jgi:beta-lactam-binding protein with PASTA domain
LRIPAFGDFPLVSMPPRDPDPLDDTVVDETARREEIVEEVPPERRPPRLWPWLLALLLLVLGGLLAYWLVLREDAKTTMPRVVGLTEVQARARIAEAELEVDADRALSDRRAGIVYAQTPGAGVQLDEGERVEIQVSSGLTRVPVPSVVDLREGAAVEALEQAGFEVEIQRVFAGAPRRTVVEQEPRGGAQAARGATVAIKVSKGRNLNTVPDVLGLSEEEAVTALRAREFEPRIFDVPSPDPEGTVVAQQPQPGEEAPPDSRVRINVSTGEQSGEPTERTAAPSVVGLAQTPALRRLYDAGFRGVVAYRASDQPRGRVIEQRALAGRFQGRAQVGVVVSSGTGAAEELEVPDVRDTDEPDARETLQDAGFRVEVIRDGDGATVFDQQPTPDVTSTRGAVVTIFVG